jgi:hypothetical protein
MWHWQQGMQISEVAADGSSISAVVALGTNSLFSHEGLPGAALPDEGWWWAEITVTLDSGPVQLTAGKDYFLWLQLGAFGVWWVLVPAD